MRRLAEIPPLLQRGECYLRTSSQFSVRGNALQGVFGKEVADSIERTLFQDKRSKIVN